MMSEEELKRHFGANAGEIRQLQQYDWPNTPDAIWFGMIAIGIAEMPKRKLTK